MPSGPSRSPLRACVEFGVVLGFALIALGLPVRAQVPSPTPAQIQPPAPVHAAPPSAAARPQPAASATKQAARQRTKPLWVELKPAQQQALVPLAPKWDTLSEAQKRKWLALSENFPKMSGAEQVKLHSRMTEWVALSPQQRTEARLNFGQTKQLSADDKKAKWEAYQALPVEEKRKLAARAAKPPATAAAVKPVAPDKLAVAPKSVRRHTNPAARVAATPLAADHVPLAPASRPAAPAPPAAN